VDFEAVFLCGKPSLFGLFDGDVFFCSSMPGKPALAIRSQVASSATPAISAFCNFVLNAALSAAREAKGNPDTIPAAAAVFRKFRLFISSLSV